MNKPSWATDRHASTWERMKEALRRDRDQTNHVLRLGEHELNQNVDGILKRPRSGDLFAPHETDSLERADAVVGRDDR